MVDFPLMLVVVLHDGAVPLLRQAGSEERLRGLPVLVLDGALLDKLGQLDVGLCGLRVDAVAELGVDAALGLGPLQPVVQRAPGDAGCFGCGLVGRAFADEVADRVDDRSGNLLLAAWFSGLIRHG